MKPLKVLITSIGFFGSYSLIKNLKANGEREITIVGTDMNGNCAGRLQCDEFYNVPSGFSSDYIPSLLSIVKKDKIDVILPASSYEVYPLSFHRAEFEKLGVKVMVSEPSQCQTALNKGETYQALQGIIELPEFFYSDRGYCIKPLAGKGARGIKIVKDNKAMIMEKLEGEEIDVDVLSWKGEVLLCMMKTRSRAYGGTLVEGELVMRSHIFEQIRKIYQNIKIDYLSVVQFIGGKLIELNPRIAGAVFYPSGWNMPYLAVKLALGELKPDDIKKYQSKVPLGLKMARYLRQIQYE